MYRRGQQSAMQSFEGNYSFFLIWAHIQLNGAELLTSFQPISHRLKFLFCLCFFPSPPHPPKKYSVLGLPNEHNPNCQNTFLGVKVSDSKLWSPDPQQSRCTLWKTHGFWVWDPFLQANHTTALGWQKVAWQRAGSLCWGHNSIHSWAESDWKGTAKCCACHN